MTLLSDKQSKDNEGALKQTQPLVGDLTLVIMAAGIGSRYGGIKQIAPVGAHGELIIDYSIHDAIAAGFTRVVFVIRREIEKDFCEAIYNRIKRRIKAEYVFQDIDDLPSGFSVPNGREKPWGTGHAVLAARNVVKEPFCVINADDFYGPDAFKKITKFFAGKATERQYCIVGYKLVNTLTDKGTVSRGVCKANEKGFITDITEYRKIERQGAKITDLETGAVFTEGTDVSVNFWGFTPDIFTLLEKQFIAFLENNNNPKTGEFWIPAVASALINSGDASVKLLTSNDTWRGMTYREELDKLKKEIAKLNYPKII